MSDLIERGTVLAFVRRCKDRLQGKGLTYDILVDYVESIPSAERKGEWIPCSKRLPEWNTRVLFYLEKECYYDYPEPQYVTDWWIQEGLFNDKYGAYVYDSPDIGKGIPKDYVVAWMPLPKPWKGADDE